MQWEKDSQHYRMCRLAYSNSYFGLSLISKKPMSPVDHFQGSISLPSLYFPSKEYLCLSWKRLLWAPLVGDLHYHELLVYPEVC